MQALCRLPPTAKGSLPSAADGKEATWQATVLPGRLTNLVSLPIVANGKGFAVGGGRQRVKTLPTAATAKACRVVTSADITRRTAKAFRSLPSAADGKGLRLTT